MKEFTVKMNEDEDCNLSCHGWCKHFSVRKECPSCGDLNARPDWCPLKEHDMGECAEKHKEEMEEFLRKTIQKIGW